MVRKNVICTDVACKVAYETVWMPLLAISCFEHMFQIRLRLRPYDATNVNPNAFSLRSEFV